MYKRQEYYGGYPNGYIKVAGMSDLEITKNAPGAADVASDRGVVIKMVYNALLGQYKEINGYENGAPTYKANGTLAKAKFDVIDKKGVLTATSKTSVSSTDVQDGQIEIVSDEDDEAKLFDCDLTGLEAVSYTHLQRQQRLLPVQRQQRLLPVQRQQRLLL